MRIALLFGIVLFCVASLFGHDMWIEPTGFFPAVGQIVGARLRVGQELLGDPIPRTPELIREFVFIDREGRKTLVGRDGADPAGYLRVASAGVVVIGYFSNPSRVDLPADKFNQYLKDEGLDQVLTLRARRNQSGANGRELFSRCAKSLLLSGAAGPEDGDRKLGFPLELVAERNPYAIKLGEDLPVRLTHQGRAVAGILVVAMNRAKPAEKLAARTDAEGRVHFRLAVEGMWMLQAVHMIPAAAGADADWLSHWASLTFEMRGRK